MKRGDLRERGDVSFHSQPDYVAQLTRDGHSYEQLNDWIESIESGSFVSPSDVGESGIPIYQVNSIVDCELKPPMGRTSLSNIKKLNRGDFLTGRVGSIGEFAIFDSDEDASFSDNLLRFSLLKEREPRSRFLFYFLNSNLAAQQIVRFRKGSLQGVINQTTLRSLTIPLTSKNEEELVAQLDAAREERAMKLRRADEIVNGLDTFLLDNLGLQTPQVARRGAFGVQLSQLKQSRFDVSFHVAQSVAARDGLYPEKPLIELVSLLSGGTPSKAEPEFWDGEIPWVSPKDFRSYLLNDAEDHISETGRKAAGLALLPSGTVLMVVRSGVLKHSLPVTLTTCPVAINQDLKALLPRPDSQLSGDYLAAYFEIMGRRLLPSIVKHSTTVQSINTPQLELLPIPLPPLEIQNQIAAEVQNRREEARLLRAEAQSDWDAAKAEFERQLLGGAE